MNKKIIGLIMILIFFCGLIAYCIYRTGDFWRGVGVFSLAILLTAFVVTAVYLFCSDENDY